MSHNKIWRILCVALLFVLSVSSIHAQIELDATYISHDGSFRFDYPNHGQATIDDESYVGSIQIIVPLYGTDYNINVFSPWLTQVQIDGVQSLEMAKEVLSHSMASDETVFEITQFQSRQMLEFFDETKGFWLLSELENNGYVLIGVHAQGQRRSRLRDLARAIAFTYTYQYPVIENYANDWQDVMSELQDKSIITTNGNLIFSYQPTLTYWGEMWILDDYAAHMNVVMSAEITVSGDARCGLMTHIQPRMIGDSEETFSLDVMLNTHNTHSGIGYTDQFGVMSRAFEFIHMPIEDGASYHYLMITDNRHLSIYIDGIPLVEDVPIAPVEGYYGLFFEPISAESTCQASNLWIVEHDAPMTDETCQAVFTVPADGRLWPTHTQTIDTFETGAMYPISCHHKLETGELWYMLRNGIWIQANKVRLIGDCGDMPTIY